MEIYDFEVTNSSGKVEKLDIYRNKVLLIVNTASKCGLTPQFKDLELLYERYKDRGFEIIGFPSNQFAGQEPGTNEEIQEFCQRNYGVTFKVYAKIDVNGDNAAPLYKFLKSEKSGLFGEAIKWNFTKFLIDRNGNVVKRFSPTDQPLSMEEDIKRLID